VTFSCDKKVDKWTHDNYSQLKSMNRQEILNLKGEYQMAAYRTLSPEKRAALWKLKLDEVLKLKWSPMEYKHIALLANGISTNWFLDSTNNSKYESIMAKSFVHEWAMYGKKSIGWSNEMIESIAMRLDTPISSNGYLLESFDLTKTDAGDPKPVRCKCSSEDDWCSFGSRCGSSVCTETMLGCGLLFMYDCDGMCSEFSK